MPLLTALWFAVLSALATVATSPLRGGGDQSLRVPSARLSGIGEEVRGRAHSHAASAVGRWAPPQKDEGVRAPDPRLLRLVGRTAERGSGTPFSVHGAAGAAHVCLGTLPAAGTRVVARHVSHATAARGGHLPYFPTAPPLQG